MRKLLKLTDNNFINGMIFFVLGGIGYATVTAKLGEWLSYIWAGLIAALNFILSIFKYEVAVWKVIVFFILMIGALFLFALWQNRKVGTTNISDPSIKSITELDKQILRIFEGNYGKRLTIKSIARILSSSDMLII